MISTLRKCAGMLIGIFVCATALADASLMVENAWIPLAAPAVKVHAAYMSLANRTPTDKDIVAAHSPDYERIELHRSSVEGGVTTMQAIEKATVPASGRLELAPAGLHLMLVGPKRQLGLGSHVQIVLRLSGGEEVDVNAVIRRREDAVHGAHAHH
jgi:periplasmic copper chaperone A